MGKNAIHRAVPLLERCAAFDAAVVEVDALEYREALQVVRVDGGVANNVVPDRCEVVINRRYAPSRDLDAAIDEMRALCHDADHLEVVNASPAAPPNLSNPLVAELLGVYNLPVRPKLGWTDVARFSAYGIPACNFGSGRSRARPYGQRKGRSRRPRGLSRGTRVVLWCLVRLVGHP